MLQTRRESWVKRGLYRDNGKENGNYYSTGFRVWGVGLG